jgi:hypothetical protein
MKKLFTLVTIVLIIPSLWATKIDQDKAKNELITEVQNNLILNYFPEDDSFKESAQTIKLKMTEKMQKNYSVAELKELKSISENKTFLAVNSKFQDQNIKIEDILTKTASEELKKIDSKKQPIITSIKKTLSLDKYSQQATHVLEKKLDEQLPAGLPEMALKPLKEGLKSKAQDGLIATIYEQLGKVETTELKNYQQQIKKQSFHKYFHDLMDTTYSELK